MIKLLLINLVIFSTAFYLADFRGKALYWRIAFGTLVATLLSLYPLIG